VEVRRSLIDADSGVASSDAGWIAASARARCALPYRLERTFSQLRVCAKNGACPVAPTSHL